eukprot:440876-Rhodomonas_salina.2
MSRSTVYPTSCSTRRSQYRAQQKLSTAHIWPRAICYATSGTDKQYGGTTAQSRREYGLGR